jgi:putative transposase
MGYKINHKRVNRLRKELRIRTVYPRPRFRTSEPCEEHEKYPYLLHKLKIERPNQVWATDITYSAVAGGRVFIIAIIDLYSRKVMSYCVVNTMDADHCINILEEAIRCYGKPGIFNSDQGSQFTSADFIEALKKHNIKISMDGKGRCLDNAKMERFWWSLKYENIYLNDYKSLPHVRMGVQSYVNFYNSRRIHSALDWKTPNEVYGQACNLQSEVYTKSESLHLSFY